MTTTQKSMTAAEAMTFATQLAAKERDLAERQAAARQAATFKAHEVSLSAETSALSEAADDATKAWTTAAADPLVGLDELFLCWVTMRATSAVRAQHVADANMVMGQIRPRLIPGDSHPIPYRPDTHDPRVRDQFMPAVEGAINARVLAAVNAHRNAQQAAVNTAADNAANAIN